MVSTTEMFGFVAKKVFKNSDRLKGCVNVSLVGSCLCRQWRLWNSTSTTRLSLFWSSITHAFRTNRQLVEMQSSSLQNNHRHRDTEPNKRQSTTQTSNNGVLAQLWWRNRQPVEVRDCSGYLKMQENVLTESQSSPSRRSNNIWENKKVQQTHGSSSTARHVVINIRHSSMENKEQNCEWN